MTHKFKSYPKEEKYFVVTVKQCTPFPEKPRVFDEVFENVEYYTLDVEKMEIIMRIGKEDVKRNFMIIKTDPDK